MKQILSTSILFDVNDKKKNQNKLTMKHWRTFILNEKFEIAITFSRKSDDGKYARK